MPLRAVQHVAHRDAASNPAAFLARSCFGLVAEWIRPIYLNGQPIHSHIVYEQVDSGILRDNSIDRNHIGYQLRCIHILLMLL